MARWNLLDFLINVLRYNTCTCILQDMNMTLVITLTSS